MTDQPAPPAIDFTDHAAFAYWSHDKVRFSDVDRYGHINNVAFAVYCESGRVDYLESILPGSTDGKGSGWVIVKLMLEFLSQATFPGQVDVGSRIERIGRSSVTLRQGLFKDAVCFARAESVLVWVDLDSGGRSLPFPADVRSVLEAETAIPTTEIRRN